MLDKQDIVKVTFENGKQIKAKYKSKIGDLIKMVEKDPSDILAVRIDNEVKSYDYAVVSNCDCEYIKYATEDGERIYGRSLKFIMFMAFREVYPEAKIEFTNRMEGDHFALISEIELTKEVQETVKNKMKEIAEKDYIFNKLVVTYDEAKAVYTKMGDLDKIESLNNRLKGNYTIHECNGMYNYMYGALLPSTGYIKGFDLRLHRNGILLVLPEKDNVNKVKKDIVNNKIYDVFEEHGELAKLIKVEAASQLNDRVINSTIGEVIRFSEAVHDRKLVELALKIEKRKDVKIILIAGPSSSGKTTFAQKLGVQLSLSGRRPITISMDNYFKERKDTPVGLDGKLDFDCIEAMDSVLFNKQMKELIEGREVELPTFNFLVGKKEYNGKKLKLEEKDILIVEGIHGLNPLMSEFIPANNKFKIYVAPIATLNLDRYTKVSSTDVRLIRRIVRDIVARGHGVEKTLELWENVRKGEAKYIFPYINTADYIYNTSLLYEQGVIKTFVQPLLLQVPRTSKYYSETRRLYEFMNNFLPIETGEIPVDSIIREFIGEGCFYR
ncbi:MAG: nucleoside kinase [Clostridia bacterium]